MKLGVVAPAPATTQPGLPVGTTDPARAALLDITSFAGRLRRAIARDELCLHFQPRHDILHGRISGLHALVRWDSVAGAAELAGPPSDPTAPGGTWHFLPAAEQAGLLSAIGDWALHAACRQTAALHAAGVPVPAVSLDVSVAELVMRDFVGRVEHALARAELPADFLEIAISAHALARAPAAARPLADLRRLGVGVCLDGFGGATSGLRSFARLPIDAVEIDRHVVASLDAPGATGLRAVSLVRALARVAKAHRLRVRAAGVVSLTQRTRLAAAGVDDLQGDLLTPPLAPGELGMLFASRRQLPAVSGPC